MSKTKKINKSEKSNKKVMSTGILFGAGVPIALLGILFGYFTWGIESPLAAAFAFVFAGLMGFPLIAGVFRLKRDIGFLGIFLWLTILFFARFVFDGGMLFGTDTMGMSYFNHMFYREYIHKFGSYPFWQHLLHGGMPFHSGLHGDSLYPTRILELLIPLHYALGLKLVLHVWLAGFFMFGMLRVFKFSRFSSLLGGIAYMFGPFFLSYIYAGHDGKMFVITLLPAAFWALECALSDGKLWRYLLFGLVYMFMIYSPHMQMAYFAAWGIGSYFVFRVIRMLVNKQGIGLASKHVIAFVLAVVLTLGACAVMIYPPYKYLGEYSQRTQRTEESGYEWATSWSLHPEEVGSMVVPEFAGLSLGRQNTYWGRNPFKLNSDYFGVIILILSIGAVILVRKPRTWLFFGLGTFSLIYGLGATTPLFRLFYTLIPQVKKFRGPSMIIFLAAFSAIILSCYIIDAIVDENRRRELIDRGLLRYLAIAGGAFIVISLIATVMGKGFFNGWSFLLYRGIDSSKKAVMAANASNLVKGAWIGVLLLAASLGALFLALRDKISATIAITVIIMATGLDLLRVDKPFIQIVNPEAYFGASSSINWLRKKTDEKPFRVLVTPRSYQDSQLALHGIEEVVFGVGHGNQLRSFDEFIGRSEGPERLFSRAALGLLNIDYIAVRGRQMGLPVAFSEGDLILYNNPMSLPRAFPIYDWVSVSSMEDARDMVFSPNFPVERKGAIEGEVSMTPTRITDSLYSPLPAESFEREGSEIEISVTMAYDGLLFISENWYPEWHAYEGEKELPIIRADGTFMAVPLDKGTHNLRLVFEPKTFMKSLTVSLIFFGVAIALFVFSLILAKREKSMD